MLVSELQLKLHSLKMWRISQRVELQPQLRMYLKQLSSSCEKYKLALKLEPSHRSEQTQLGLGLSYQQYNLHPNFFRMSTYFSMKKWWWRYQISWLILIHYKTNFRNIPKKLVFHSDSWWSKRCVLIQLPPPSLKQHPGASLHKG